jgi:hypothetical protein
LDNRMSMWFQQDGCPARTVLNRAFRYRWTRRGGHTLLMCTETLQNMSQLIIVVSALYQKLFLKDIAPFIVTCKLASVPLANITNICFKKVSNRWDCSFLYFVV